MSLFRAPGAKSMDFLFQKPEDLVKVVQATMVPDSSSSSSEDEGAKGVGGGGEDGSDGDYSAAVGAKKKRGRPTRTASKPRTPSAQATASMLPAIVAVSSSSSDDDGDSDRPRRVRSARRRVSSTANSSSNNDNKSKSKKGVVVKEDDDDEEIEVVVPPPPPMSAEESAFEQRMQQLRGKFSSVHKEGELAAEQARAEIAQKVEEEKRRKAERMQRTESERIAANPPPAKPVPVTMVQPPQPVVAGGKGCIQIKIRSKKGSMELPHLKTAPLEVTLLEWCKRNDVARGSVRFTFDGQRIDATQTLKSLDVDEEDEEIQIDAVV